MSKPEEICSEMQVTIEGEVSPPAPATETAEAAKVREAFLKGCDPLDFSDWEMPLLNETARRVPEDTRALFAKIVKRFGEDATVATGLATPADKGVVLDKRYDKPGAIILAIRDRSSKRVRSLLINDGEALTSAAILSAVSDDDFRGVVWLTLGPEESAILRGLGHVTVPAGAIQFHHGGAQAFRQTFPNAKCLVLTVSALADTNWATHPLADTVLEAIRARKFSDKCHEAGFEFDVIHPLASERREFLTVLQQEQKVLQGYTSARSRDLRRGLGFWESHVREVLAAGLPQLDPMGIHAGPLTSAYRQAKIEITSIGPTKDLPMKAQMAEAKAIPEPLMPSGPRPQLPDFFLGMAVRLPAECIAELADVETRQMPMVIYRHINGGQSPHFRARVPRDTEDGSTQYDPLPVHLLESRPVRKAKCHVLDADGGRGHGEAFEVLLVSAPPLSVGMQVQAAVLVFRSPTNGQRMIWAEDIEPLASGAGATGPRGREGLLDPFVVDGSIEGLRRRSEQLLAGLCAAVRVTGAQAGLMAMVTALVHVCPQKLTLPDGRVPRYGPLQVLILGESGSLKTTIVSGLAEAVGLARMATADTVTRAGLLYQSRGDAVLPGLLPANHGRMVVIDEFHKIRPQDISAATSARSSGVLHVDGRNTATFPTQTRVTAIGNLRPSNARGAPGSRSVCLADLEAGILGAGFLEPEDLRRFDVTMVVGREEHSAPPSVVEPADLSQFPDVIAFYWQLGQDGADECLWHDNAFELLQTAAATFRNRYETPRVPVFGPDTIDKLARLAAAAARLMPVSNDGRIHIVPAHVEWTVDFVESIYELPTNGLAKLAQHHHAGTSGISDDQAHDLFNILLGEVPEFQAIIDTFHRNGQASTALLAAEARVSPRTMGARIKHLKTGGLVTTHGRNGVAPTPAMERIVHLFHLDGEPCSPACSDGAAASPEPCEGHER